MISAWWLIPAIVIGAVFGIVLIGIVSANREEMEKGECCETCKFYKDGWCELLFVGQEPEHKCQSDYESKGEC